MTDSRRVVSAIRFTENKQFRRSVLWVRLQEALNEIISILSYHLLIVVILRPITEPDPGWLVQPQNVGIIIPREIVRSCGFPIGIHSAGPIFREEGQC